MDMTGYLAGLSQDWQDRFVDEKRVLSFAQYLALFSAHPDRLGRNAAQYLKDLLDHHGTRTIDLPTGPVTRHTLFDAPFDENRERLIGQEEVQTGFYRVLSDFVREGKASRLVLLHGPNGSAKTSFVQSLARAMVAYSQADDGAVYTFNWIFPRTSALGKRVGFKAESQAVPPMETYAFL